MIKGFAEHALIVYPLLEDFQGKGSNYKSHIDKATRNIKKYLEMNNVTYDCYITDDVARDVAVIPDRWLCTLNQGDMYFVTQNCEGMNTGFSNRVEFEEVYAKSAEKYPIPRGTSIDTRFETILKRDSFARRLILKTYEMIILFKQPKSPTLNVTTKKGSGLLYIEIDNTSFKAKAWMSDMEMDVTDMLGIKNGFMPVYEWEVE